MSVLKSAAARLAAASRLPALLHRRLYPQDVTILMYHAVVDRPLPVSDWCFLDADLFRTQLRYLAAAFDVVPLSSLSERMKSVSRRPVAVITFDDGYQNNFDVAFPMLKEFRLPASIFLTTDLIGSDGTVWFCRLHRAITETKLTELAWKERRFDLRGSEARSQASAAMQSALKGLDPAAFDREVEDIIGRLGDDPARPVEPSSPFRMLGRTAVREMADSGWIEFGAHTRSHRILSRLAPDAQKADISASVEATAALTGRPCRLFAYPNGRAQDYGADTVSMVAECGVAAAVTTISGPTSASTPPLELRRYGVGHGISQAVFELTAHHALHRMRGS